jgi:thioredoxin 1
MTEHLTTESFRGKIFDFSKGGDWKFLGKRPAFIDFYADWCMPCKMLSPVIDELAKEYAGKVDIFKIDTQAEQALAASFGIMSIPSLLFVPLEGDPKMVTGGRSKEELKGLFKDLLGVEI